MAVRYADPAEPAEPLRVFVADDLPLTAAGFQSVLAASPAVQVIEVCSSLEHVVPEATRHKPDIVLLDLHWYGDYEAGIKLIPQLRTALRDTGLLAYTAFELLVPKARRAGAHVAVERGE